MEQGRGEQKNMEETLFLFSPRSHPLLSSLFSRLTLAETLATQACKNARKKWWFGVKCDKANFTFFLSIVYANVLREIVYFLFCEIAHLPLP